MNMNRMGVIAVLAGIAVLSACSSLPGGKPPARGPAHIFYSPTGDPLNGGPLGRPTCPEAMKRWFGRADANHDGAVTLDEFLSDARMQFGRMDIDKNGYLVAEELERFRMTYRDYSAGEKAAHHGQREGGGNSGGSMSSVIDPVMSADASLDYKVTLDEFLTYSRKTFSSLDAAHTGKLNPAAVISAMCGVRDEH